MLSRVREHTEQDSAVIQEAQVTYSSLCFLLDLTGPCLVGHLEGVILSTSSSKYCLATLALYKIISAERGSEVEPEVDGTASEGK